MNKSEVADEIRTRDLTQNTFRTSREYLQILDRIYGLDLCLYSSILLGPGVYSQPVFIRTNTVHVFFPDI